jgi:hypothetical protein
MFFRQGEMSNLLRDCRTGLQQGRDDFKVCYVLGLHQPAKRNIIQIKTIDHTSDIMEMQEDTERRHQEVLNMIEALSDTTSLDTASSVRQFQYLHLN